MKRSVERPLHGRQHVETTQELQQLQEKYEQLRLVLHENRATKYETVNTTIRFLEIF